jgi:hypothetical protein
MISFKFPETAADISHWLSFVFGLGTWLASSDNFNFAGCTDASEFEKQS